MYFQGKKNGNSKQILMTLRITTQKKIFKTHD